VEVDDGLRADEGAISVSRRGRELIAAMQVTLEVQCYLARSPFERRPRKAQHRAGRRPPATAAQTKHPLPPGRLLPASRST
jgi:hypothetical protein